MQANEYEALLKERVLDRIDLSYDICDDDIQEIINRELSILSKDEHILFKDRMLLGERVFNSLRKLDVLEDLLKDDEVTEIMINGYDTIFIEKNGKLIKADVGFTSKERLDDIIQIIVSANNRIVNESSPIVDARLEDGSRVNIVLEPASVKGSIVSIRKFPKTPMTMGRLLEFGAINKEIADCMKRLVEAGYNIVVSGGTGSGKTSFLNALAEYIPKDQRVITIEDSAELQLFTVDNLVRLEARNSNLEGKNQITIRDLLKTSLRMRPDRLIIGECRGAEALEILQSANTGHDGTCSTLHSNSCKDALSRLEVMTMMAGEEMPLNAIRQQIAAGIDIVVQLSRIRDGSRKLIEISEIDAFENGEIKLNTLYRFYELEEIDGKVTGEWRRESDLKHQGKLKRRGLTL
ncbi:MAG: CpaF family protein [Pseudobutyrivibrio sp.]|nr:CpaF family protein [Pseudobutyrivibrio sp.]